MDTLHVPLNRGRKTREGTKSGVESLERINRSNGIKGQDDKSSGIEILMTEDFAKIKPNDPSNQLRNQCEENEIDPIPPVVH